MKEKTAQDILEFWFHTIDQSHWWSKNEAIDKRIRQEFEQVHQQAMACELYQWRKEPLGCLAEIIVLDQFSRNMYRNTPFSFAADSLALALAQYAIAQGADQNLTPIQKSFLYMPYMHSESKVIHEEAVKLYSQPGLEYNLDFELKHLAIIEHFGRYPHRNAILGRHSTEAEIRFLEEPGSSF